MQRSVGHLGCGFVHWTRRMLPSPGCKHGTSPLPLFGNAECVPQRVGIHQQVEEFLVACGPFE